MPDVKEVYDMVTRQKLPEPGALERQQKRQVRTARNRKLGGYAVAAVIGLAATVAVILGTRGGPDTTRPAGEPPTVAPMDATPEAVAASFVEAYGALDTEEAITYLADDADLLPLVGQVGTAEGLEGTPDDLRLHISLLQAMGYEQLLGSCEELTAVSSGSVVRCTLDFHLIRSDEIGRGPFSGGYIDVTVRDGEVTRVSQTWEIEKFSPQIWEPFADWVTTKYPEDAAVMYDDETQSYARLGEESIRLWERRSLEYAEEVGQRNGE